MISITPEQRLALAEAGDSPVVLTDPLSGDAFVIVREPAYRKRRELLKVDAYRRDREAWGKVARVALESWARENPY
jgi:hypothetical protein